MSKAKAPPKPKVKEPTFKFVVTKMEVIADVGLIYGYIEKEGSEYLFIPEEGDPLIADEMRTIAQVMETLEAAL